MSAATGHGTQDTEDVADKRAVRVGRDKKVLVDRSMRLFEINVPAEGPGSMEPCVFTNLPLARIYTDCASHAIRDTVLSSEVALSTRIEWTGNNEIGRGGAEWYHASWVETKMPPP